MMREVMGQPPRIMAQTVLTLRGTITHDILSVAADNQLQYKTLYDTLSPVPISLV